MLSTGISMTKKKQADNDSSSKARNYIVLILSSMVLICIALVATGTCKIYHNNNVEVDSSSTDEAAKKDVDYVQVCI